MTSSAPERVERKWYTSFDTARVGGHAAIDLIKSDGVFLASGAQCDWRHREPNTVELQWVKHLGKYADIVDARRRMGGVVVDDTQWSIAD